MKILVTGGSGFIGGHVVDALLAAGYDDIAVLDTRPPHAGAVTWERATLLDGEAVARAIAGANAVIHLAGTVSHNTLDDLRLNVMPSVALFELCAAAGVSHVVFASSGGAVYGCNSGCTEDGATWPISVNGASKLAIEGYLRATCVASDKMTHTILRIANPYGERQPTNGVGVVAAFMAAIAAGRAIEVWGDGSVVRDYIYIGDVARAFVAALEYGRGGPFNVGTGVGTSINELIAKIASAACIAPEVRYTAERASDTPVSVLNCGFAHRVLGWKAETALDDGLAKTWRYYRGND